MIKYFWADAETYIIRRTLKTLNKQSSTLKWVEFIRRKDAGWWKCKCSGYQIELGTVPTTESSVAKRGMNAAITLSVRTKVDNKATVSWYFQPLIRAKVVNNSHKKWQFP